MLQIEALFLFVFIFTLQVILKNIIKFTGALLGKEVFFSGRDLLFFYLASSYFITYLIYI